jgi:signal transduction histidine kinase
MGVQQWLRLPRRRRAFAADPDEALFARLFRRLILWYMSLLAILVLALGLGIGTTVPWILFVSSEHGLAGQVAQLAATWRAAPSGEVCPLALPAHGYMLACYNARGQLVKSFGVGSGNEAHFLDNSLALAALHDGSTAQDALDETGSGKVTFDFVFLGSARPDIVRQAMVVRGPNHAEVLGVVQLGTTPAETLARRAVIVNIFFAAIFIGLFLCTPLGGWYLARNALRPLRLAFQRQRDFIANVSHELRTPLSLLRANADVLLRGRTRLAEEDAELLEDISAEAVYMDKLTSNMLLLAQMDAGQLHLEQEVLSLAEVAQGVVRRAQSLAAQAQIALDCQEEEAAHVLSDRVLLEQATLILLDNALKYNQPGGKVSVRTFREDGRACLRVSDTGIGIAPEELARLGERFYRVDKARAREAGGHGLGLSIARGIAAVHYGSLALTSEPGKGTTATLSLPLAER